MFSKVQKLAGPYISGTFSPTPAYADDEIRIDLLPVES